MSREIYRRTVAPHNMRVATDAGVPSDNVQAAILLMQDNLEWVGRDKFMCISPELFGVKTRVSAPNTFATKAYSANSPQRELGDELIINAADREFTSDTGFWTKSSNVSITDGVCRVNSPSHESRFIKKTLFLTAGKWYSVSVNCKSITQGGFKFTDDFSEYGNTETTTGVKTVIFQALYHTIGIIAKNNLIGDFDNISIREVLAADLTQSTANSQPYLSKIAPSEPQGLQNTNGDSRFMSRSAISFAANEKWCVEVVLNWNQSNLLYNILCGESSSTGTGIILKDDAGNAGRWSFANASNGSANGTTTLSASCGKNTVYHFVANGNGTLSLYRNGVFVETINVATNSIFSQLFYARNIAYPTNGKICNHSIIPDAPSASRIQYRAALLRSIFAEIPTVRVAGLDVAVRALDIVCTPAGNLIPNVTDNSAWAALTTPAWCHHSNDLALGSVYGKLFNGYAKDQLVADLASSNFGYHIATEAEWNAILATGVAGLKAMGTAYWIGANGTNVSGLTLLGGNFRSSAGVFDTIKNGVVFWCAESGRRLNINNDNTYDFATRPNTSGYYILLIKNY